MPKVEAYKSQRALVTGSRGIGGETAIELARLGYDVDLTYLSKEKRAMPVVNAIRRMGRRATLIQADLSTPEGVDHLLKRVRRPKSAPLTAVSLNVAGGLEPGKGWEHALALNVEGQSRLIDGLMKDGMAEAGRFSLVSSHWSHFGSRVVEMPPFPGLDYGIVADSKYIGAREAHARQNWLDERGIIVDENVIGFVRDTAIGAIAMSRLPAAYLARQEDMGNVVSVEQAGQLVASSLSSISDDELVTVLGADLDEFLENEGLDRVWRHNPELPIVDGILTHEEPRVRLDGVLECQPGLSATGFYRVKKENVKGHFGIMPGVEIAEAAAQAGAYAIMMETPGEVGVLLDSINDFVFTDMVLGGETITSDVRITSRNGDQFTGEAIVKVDGKEAARGTISGRVTKSGPGDTERGVRILQKRRARARADAINAGIDPHLALAPRETELVADEAD